MKFGVVFCGYNVEETAVQSLSPFLNDERFEVAVVSVPFKGYESMNYKDNTTNILKEFNDHLKCDVIDSPEYITEADARNLALQAVLDNDYIWLVDGDEIYTKEEIDNIIEFVEKNPVPWYRICLQNFVFDETTYLEEPFCPPRIFRTHFDGYFDPSFYWDNDIQYVRIGEKHPISYEGLKNLTIPQEVAWVKHLTWLNCEYSRRKVVYQQNHFGHCSFKWVRHECNSLESNGHLEFDDEYYEKTGEQKPVVVYKKDKV